MSKAIPSIAVVGLGTFGGTVAKDLAALGHHVIGMDVNESRVNDFADILSQAVIADARDERAMRDAGIDQCDVVVIAMGEDLEANIMGAMNARMLGVEQVWVKSRSRTHRRILSKIGVDHVVNPEQDMGRRVAQRIHTPFVTDYMSVGGNRVIVSLTAPKKLIGKSLATVALNKGDEPIESLGLVRTGQRLAYESNPTIEAEDMLLFYGRRADLQTFSETQCR